MVDAEDSWGARAKARINRVVERINQFEDRGGLGGAVQRSVDWFRAEQERLRTDLGDRGPIAHLHEVRRAYARLEVTFGSDLDTVRRSYRRLMRRYHPDRHAADPERERVATEIAQNLTVSYNTLVSYLQR